MTAKTATKPLPPHGTTARATGRPHAGIKGCPCRPCRKAHNAYKKRLRYLTSTGRSVTVDATESAEHLRMLLAAGNGWDETAAALNMSTSTLSYLVTGRQERIGRARAEQILALQPDPIPNASVDALGSTRRVQALIALGHRFRDIAHGTGLEKTVICDLANQRLRTIRRSTAEAVDHGYQQLRQKPGSFTRSLNRARREGWPTPTEWAGDIDDPDVDPATWIRDDNGRRRSADLVEDAEFIQATTGVSIELAAERLGVPRNTLDRARERIAARARTADPP